MKDAAELVRIACNADGNFAFDHTKRKSPGRGAYLCRSADCFEKAKKIKGLERAFKRAIPAEIYAKLETELG